MEEEVKKMWANLTKEGRVKIANEIKENVVLAEHLKTAKTPKEFFSVITSANPVLFDYAPDELKNDREYVKSLINITNESVLSKYVQEQEFEKFIPTADEIFGNKEVKALNENIVEESLAQNFNEERKAPSVIAYRQVQAAKSNGLNLIVTGILGIVFSIIVYLITSALTDYIVISYGIAIFGVISIITGVINLVSNKSRGASINSNLPQEALLETGNGNSLIIQNEQTIVIAFSDIQNVDKKNTYVLSFSDGTQVLAGTVVIKYNMLEVEIKNVLAVDVAINYIKSKISN